MSDDDVLQRVKGVETEIINLKGAVSEGFKEIKELHKEGLAKSDKRHGEHYKSDGEQDIKIAKVEERFDTLRWVVGIGLTIVSIGIAFVGFLKK